MVEKMKILNIYGQAEEHLPAQIIGNSEGLEELRDAINRAIAFGESTTKDEPEPLFASDGEGYEVIIKRNDEKWGLAGDKNSFWNRAESNPQYTRL